MTTQVISIREQLEKQLKQVITPKERIDLMNELGWELNQTTPKRTLALAEEAYSLAKALNYQKGMAYSLRNLGSSSWKLNDYATALEKLLTAKGLFEQLEERKGSAETLLYISTLHGVLGDYSTSLQYAFDGLYIARELDYKWVVSQLLNNISLSYQLLKEYNQSQLYFYQALELSIEIADLNAQAKILNNLALLHILLNDYRKALEYSQKSLELVDSQLHKDKILQSIILDTIGGIYISLGDDEQATIYLQRCLAITKEINYIYTEIHALLNLGKAYQASNLSLAIEYIEQALELATQHKVKKRQAEAHQLLTEHYERQGHYTQALHHHKQLYKLHQEIFNEESDRKIKNLEVLHRTEAARKEAQIYRYKNDELEQEIQERKRVEAELVKAKEVAEVAKEAAEVANRAKSDFLSNMSHELRTPLNAILGFSQLIMHHPALHPELRENVGIISRSGEHLLTLINNVLDLSKIEAGHTTLNKKNFDLYRLLDDLEDMFQLKAEDKNLHIIFEVIGDVPPYVRTDETKLRQVLINLLNNAIKFTEEGGVSVRVGYKEAPAASYLLFEVQDTGAGIAENELGALFEAFVQSKTGKESQEGTGLGLPISRKFIELMGGEIKVKSKEGYGTIFIFEIQVEVIAEDEIQSKPLGSRRVVALEPNQPRYRILVVDDKAVNRQLLLKLLLPLGFAVKEASNGQEAIDIFVAWKPSLIWMDMRMPVIDGYEATRRIKETAQGQATSIIALTASTLEEEQVITISAGCDGFMRKPFREAEIFEMMNKHLGVCYIYEETQTSPTPSKNEEALTATALATLPKELLDALGKACIRADMMRIEELIEQIHALSATTADGLAALAEDFEYSQILKLIEF